MYTEIIIEKLKQARREAGYTQDEVANATDIPRTMIAKMESGHRRPDVETLGTLAEFYCVTTDWLFGIGQKKIN